MLWAPWASSSWSCYPGRGNRLSIRAATVRRDCMKGASTPAAWTSWRAGMKYLLMIYGAEVDPATVPPERARQVAADYDVFTQDISQRGVMLGGEALQPTTAATSVRVQNGRAVITDGPFAETKEALSGFYLV